MWPVNGMPKVVEIERKKKRNIDNRSRNMKGKNKRKRV